MTNCIIEKKPILTLQKVTKHFGGVVAAQDVNIELYKKEVFGLIGPNGSGKTTILNLINGILPIDSGSIFLDGKNITNYPIHRRAFEGIARTFQHPRLLDRCNIMTNILVGVDVSGKKRLPNAKNYLDRMKMLIEVAGLAKVNINDSIEKLSYGQQKMIEIVRALLTRPKVLLLDEPAAGLNYSELDYIRLLIGIAIEEDIAVLLIEHSMDLVMEICDRITVLNFGNQIANGVPSEIQENPLVIAAYLGGGIEVA
jgi:branched-chain amino acid transport system ATP-binding protein